MGRDGSAVVSGNEERGWKVKVNHRQVKDVALMLIYEKTKYVDLGLHYTLFDFGD